MNQDITRQQSYRHAVGVLGHTLLEHPGVVRALQLGLAYYKTKSAHNDAELCSTDRNIDKNNAA